MCNTKQDAPDKFPNGRPSTAYGLRILCAVLRWPFWMVFEI
jgi:hypothetical protein